MFVQVRKFFVFAKFCLYFTFFYVRENYSGTFIKCDDQFGTKGAFLSARI